MEHKIIHVQYVHVYTCKHWDGWKEGITDEIMDACTHICT